MWIISFCLLLVIIASNPCDINYTQSTEEFNLTSCTYTQTQTSIIFNMTYVVINDGAGALADRMLRTTLCKDQKRYCKLQHLPDQLLQQKNHHLGQTIISFFYVDLTDAYYQSGLYSLGARLCWMECVSEDCYCRNKEYSSINFEIKKQNQIE